MTPNEDAAQDYLTCLRAAWPVADYIAINFSSPNTPGLRDLQAAEPAARLLASPEIGAVQPGCGNRTQCAHFHEGGAGCDG